jgi:hypothetical protein
MPEQIEYGAAQMVPPRALEMAGWDAVERALVECVRQMRAVPNPNWDTLELRAWTARPGILGMHIHVVGDLDV